MLSVAVDRLTPTDNGFIVDASDLGLRAGSNMPVIIEVTGPAPTTFRFTTRTYHGEGEDREMSGWDYDEIDGIKVLHVAND